MKKAFFIIGTAALLLIGCGRAENVEEGETIALTRPESGNTVSQRITEQLPQAPEEVNELEEGSEEWKMIMDAYAEESTPFWKQVEALMPLQWGEEIPGLGTEEMFAINYGYSYPGKTGIVSDLYMNGKTIKRIGGGARLSEKFEEEDFQGPTEWITEDIEMEEIEGVHTKLHGIFVSKGEGELHYWLESPSGEILWDYTKGQGCQQVFSDVDMTEEGTYRMYLQIQSGSPFRSWGQFELYSFTEEANEKADEEYAALHGSAAE